MSMLKPPHSGIYHCCTFCSSGGKKEATCGCGGTMPGGYQGCGHGHIGHPGVSHWSCCGSILKHGRCLVFQKCMHQLLL
ncbi:E3 ubiquitin-protein ligase TRIM45 isoform X1 [Nomia melanderi]|uniref:E3 ubiquitin-protein ligase TRIM45 isoform X1 n=2 Tax=Nomia melanderi TaxID=2448451 RepID=UPI003FCCFC5C